MLSLAHLLTDVDGSVGRKSGEDRAHTLARITDLFVAGSGYTDDQVALFDAVIQRFATAIEIRARVELAERLARLANGPPETIAALAADEIAVARPILAHSPRLDDQDLMAIAFEKGRDHMLAICERPRLSACVTDVLVTHGDGVVRHAVVANPGACFSQAGTATLIEHARRDDALHQLLTERPDLSAQNTRALVEIAKDAARRRLLTSLPGAEQEVAGAVDRGASSLAAGSGGHRNYGSALATVRMLLDRHQLSESDLADFAAAGQTEEVISALATMTSLSIACIERIFDEQDNDLLIVIGKARGWSWRTVRMLLQLRNPRLSQRHHFRRAEETFDSLVSATAGRVLHFLQVRESVG